jgi:hypothetical protein
VRTERSESVITMLALPDHGGPVPFQRQASDELSAGARECITKRFGGTPRVVGSAADPSDPDSRSSWARRRPESVGKSPQPR